MKFIHSRKKGSFYNLNSIEDINCSKFGDLILIELNKMQFKIDVRGVNQQIYGSEKLEYVVSIPYEINSNIDEILEEIQLSLLNFLNSDCKVLDLDNEIEHLIKQY